MADPRLELKIGARVETTDGLFGHVHQVILSPRQKRVVGLVVRTGLLPARNWVVPTDWIEDVTEERIQLRVSRAEIIKQPEFDPEQFLPVEGKELGYQAGQTLASVHGGAGAAEDLALTAAHQREEAKVAQRGILEGDKVVLHTGQQVWATDGRAGHVDLLLLDASGHVRHFVIRRGSLLGRDVIVPVDWISRIDARGVWLAMERAALERLPSYRPDSAVASDVEQALWRDELIRVIDFEAIDVNARDGVVILSGYVSTAANKRRAERAARTVPGVLELENRIVIDEEVVSAVAAALGRDNRTREKHIFVSARHGIVTLNGDTDSPEARTTAEEVAASIPQVRGILNYIRAPGVDVDMSDQRVLQPLTGQDVYAEDVLLGRVEQVIINPRNRRVTAFVVRGNFPDLDNVKSGMPPYEMPRKERQVVIPIEVVNIVTDSSVLLTISSTQAARYPDFELENFLAPELDWQPPYPYTQADVMLESVGTLAEKAAAGNMRE